MRREYREGGEGENRKKTEVPIPNVSEVLEVISFVNSFYESMAAEKSKIVS